MYCKIQARIVILQQQPAAYLCLQGKGEALPCALD